MAWLRVHRFKPFADTSPAVHLYAIQPPPSLSLVGANPVLALSSFQEYKSTLRQKLSGRTPLLNSLLQDCEKLAATEREDLSVLIVKDQTEYVISYLFRMCLILTPTVLWRTNSEPYTLQLLKWLASVY